MYIETWYKIYCDKCKTANWFCDGDISDCTAVGIEACECFKCNHRWWIDDAGDMFREEDVSPEEHLENHSTKGLEKP